MSLGCSLSQARVYVALVQIGTSTITTLAKATGIHRENLYKIIESMVEKGLIEKQIGVPTKYRVVPPQEILPILVTHKKEQISQIETEVKKLVQSFQINSSQKLGVKSADTEFMVISGRNLIIKQLREALKNTRSTVDTITTQKRFSRAIVEFSECYERALKRGVKIRLATKKHRPEKAALEIIAELSKNPNFQVRYFSSPTPAICSLFDGKEVYISLSATANMSGSEGLWSNNHCLVAIAQAYFDETGAKSVKPDIIKKAN